MVRIKAAALLAAAMMLAGTAVQAREGQATAAAESPATDEFIVHLRSAAQKLDSDDAEGAKAEALALTQSPQFAAQPAPLRGMAWYLLAQSERRLHDYEAAWQHLNQAGETYPDVRDGDYWLAISSLGMARGQDGDAVDGLTRAIATEPAITASLRMEYVSAVVRRAGKLDDSGKAKRALLEALWQGQYVSDHPFQSADWLWWDLFEIYVQAGEDDKARQLLPSLSDPDFLISMRADKRFSRFVADAPFKGDVVKALDVDLAFIQAQTKAHPDLLEGQVALAEALRRRDRVDEALAVADQAIARAEAAPKGKPAFSDCDDQLRWIHDIRSEILDRMGRNDEVLAAQVKARDIAVATGDDLVSQAINLGDLYYSMGRSQDALDAVRGIGNRPDDASPYGLMAAEEVRACAYVQLGDQTALAKSLDYMKAHADDGYGPYRSALLCAGDGDSLAKLIIARLDDPETRTATLVDLQTYLPAPHPTAFGARTTAEFETVKARGDVQAAVAKYGKIESYPVITAGN